MIFRKDRDSRGGGVLLVIHQSIPAKVLPSPPHLEVITVKLSLPIPLVICAVYLPPNPSYGDCSDLCIYMSALSDDNKVITLGDFNLPNINWQTLNGNTETSALLCEFVYDHDFDQLVTEPTHYKGNILDLILTNCPRIVHDVTVGLSNSSISTNHYIISCSLQAPVLPPGRPKPRNVYNFRKADFGQLVDFFLEYNFEPCLSSTDLGFVWSYIKSGINQAPKEAV